MDLSTARVEERRIEKCLENDTLFRKSLGLQSRYTFTKVFLGLWVFWFGTMLLTPLPEAAMLNRLALMGAFLGSGLCVIIDFANHKLRLKDAAEKLKNTLIDDPQIRMHAGKAKTEIAHKSFTAQCNPVTAMELRSMLNVEERLQTILNETIGTGWKKKAARTSENQRREQA